MAKTRTKPGDMPARFQKVLDFIRSYSDEQGYPPTLTDIAKHLHLAGSPTALTVYVQPLVEQGYLLRPPGNRTLQVIKPVYVVDDSAPDTEVE